MKCLSSYQFCLFLSFENARNRLNSDLFVITEKKTRTSMKIISYFWLVLMNVHHHDNLVAFSMRMRMTVAAAAAVNVIVFLPSWIVAAAAFLVRSYEYYVQHWKLMYFEETCDLSPRSAFANQVHLEFPLEFYFS